MKITPILLALPSVLLSLAAMAGNDDYAAGYRDGFREGYERGIQEGRMPPPSSGPTHILLLSAVYGDYRHECDATRYVRNQTRGKFRVRIAVTNNMCGDPSPGQRKTLRVHYQCGHQQKEASAAEHHGVELDCRN